MISFTNVIDIDRSPADVHAYLSDLGHTPEWNWAISRTEKITPGPIRVGTRYRQIRTVPRPATEELGITALDDGSHIAVRGTLAQIPVRITYDLEKTSTGSRLTNHVDLEPQGGLRLVAPMLANRIKQAVSDNLRQLKRVLETKATSPRSAV